MRQHIIAYMSRRCLLTGFFSTAQHLTGFAVLQSTPKQPNLLIFFSCYVTLTSLTLVKLSDDREHSSSVQGAEYIYGSRQEAFKASSSEGHDCCPWVQRHKSLQISGTHRELSTPPASHQCRVETIMIRVGKPASRAVSVASLASC